MVVVILVLMDTIFQRELASLALINICVVSAQVELTAPLAIPMDGLQLTAFAHNVHQIAALVQVLTHVHNVVTDIRVSIILVSAAQLVM